MNKKEFILYLKKRRKIVIVSFLFIIFLFLFLSIYGPLWRIWPQSIVSRIANNKLALLLYQNPDCKEECYYTKKYYLDFIYLNLKNKKFYYQLVELVLDNDNNLDYRLEIAQLLLLYDFNSNQNIFIKEISPYINNNLLSLELSNYIILNSNNLFDYSDYISLLVKLIEDDSLALEQRKLALSYLSYLPLHDYSVYLKLLQSTDCQILTEQILFSLAKYVDNKSFNYLALISLIEDKFFSLNLQNRSLLIFLLADIAYLEDVNLYLSDLYFDKNLDEVNKLILADILNIENDLVSAGNWQDYYSNKD